MYQALGIKTLMEKNSKELTIILIVEGKNTHTQEYGILRNK